MSFEDKDVIFSYTDDQAVNDGVLHRLNDLDRITNQAFNDLRIKYPQYETNQDLIDFINFEASILKPFAIKLYNKGGILKSDFNFKVGNFKHTQILWFLPNENKGITVMKPDDY